MCKKCFNYKQWLNQNEKMKYIWIKECILFDSQISEAKKKCKGKYFKENLTVNKKMNIVKMIDWEEAENYPLCNDQNNFYDFWNCVKKFLINKSIKFDGSWHQNWEYGVPLIEYDGKFFAFAISMRRWGQLMADAFEPNCKEPYVYLKWAFSVVDNEKYPKRDKDPSL